MLWELSKILLIMGILLWICECGFQNFSASLIDYIHFILFMLLICLFTKTISQLFKLGWYLIDLNIIVFQKHNFSWDQPRTCNPLLQMICALVLWQILPKLIDNNCYILLVRTRDQSSSIVCKCEIIPTRIVILLRINKNINLSLNLYY